MAIIAPTFDRDIRDIDKAYARALDHAKTDGTYTSAKGKRLREEAATARATVAARFSRALADEFAVDLPATIQESIWDKAWEDNHDTSYFEVEYQYRELAQFAHEVWNLARQN